jgi:hypothetical protein
VRQSNAYAAQIDLTPPIPSMDEDQTPIPESFIALYLPRGRTRPTAPRQQIGARYDLCEDMAQMLTEHAYTTLFALSITEQLVLERVHQGLLAGDTVVDAAEARWITRRLAELLQWPPPQFTQDAAPGELAV